MWQLAHAACSATKGAPSVTFPAWQLAHELGAVCVAWGAWHPLHVTCDVVIAARFSAWQPAHGNTFVRPRSCGVWHVTHAGCPDGFDAVGALS